VAFLTGRYATAAALVLVAAASPQAHARSELTEAQAKAAFLYNCVLFVQWPPDASGPDLVVAIMGDADVASVAAAIEGRHVNGRVVRVRTVQPHDDLRGVHILFIGAASESAVDQVLMRLRDAPVLTVGDSADFTTKGGVVRLYTDEQRLRFEINMTQVEQKRLKISAKMLGLARIVR
jgi:hypothetical protein